MRDLGAQVGRVAAEQSRGLVENLAQTSHLIVDLRLDGLHALGELGDVVTQFVAIAAGHQAAGHQRDREHAARPVAESPNRRDDTQVLSPFGVDATVFGPAGLAGAGGVQSPAGTTDMRLAAIPVRL